jgi:AraC-like DNA-binding protein
MHRWSKMDLIYYKSEYDLISSDRTDEITPPHAHESLEIIHFKKGTCITNINGNEIECLPGNLIVIFPNTVHSHKCSPDCKYQIHIIALDILEEFQHILFSKMPEDPLIRNPDAYALKLFEDIFRFGDSLSPVTKKGLLLAMVSLILEDITFSEKNNRIANIGKIIDFCNNHFKEKISLNTLSKEIGISRSHISHTFSERIKMNFRDYINSLRIKHSVRLMNSGNMTITEIAYESGFESIRTFNRVFKQYYNMSPSEYRKTRL